MLTYFYSAMGLLALGVLWLNTLLIAAAALQQRGVLSARLDQLKKAPPREGEVVSGRGPDGALLTRTVHQVGRAMTVSGPPRILFTESKSEVEVHGGELSLGGERVELSGTPEVWLSPSAPALRTETDFDAAFKAASLNRGLNSTARQAVRIGDRVWWGAGLLATLDPLQALRARMRMLAAFAVLSVLLAGAITVVAFVPPIFGTVSTIGGALGLLFFILVQPAGVKVRNWARLPHEQTRSDVWQRS